MSQHWQDDQLRLAPTRAHRKQLSQLQWAIDNDHPEMRCVLRAG